MFHLSMDGVERTIRILSFSCFRAISWFDLVTLEESIVLFSDWMSFYTDL